MFFLNVYVSAILGQLILGRVSFLHKYERGLDLDITSIPI